MDTNIIDFGRKINEKYFENNKNYIVEKMELVTHLMCIKLKLMDYEIKHSYSDLIIKSLAKANDILLEKYTDDEICNMVNAYDVLSNIAIDIFVKELKNNDIMEGKVE